MKNHIIKQKIITKKTTTKENKNLISIKIQREYELFTDITDEETLLHFVDYLKLDPILKNFNVRVYIDFYSISVINYDTEKNKSFAKYEEFYKKFTKIGFPGVDVKNQNFVDIIK